MIEYLKSSLAGNILIFKAAEAHMFLCRRSSYPGFLNLEEISVELSSAQGLPWCEIGSPLPLPLLEELPTRQHLSTNFALMVQQPQNHKLSPEVRELRDREFGGTDYEDTPILQVGLVAFIEIKSIQILGFRHRMMMCSPSWTCAFG